MTAPVSIDVGGEQPAVDLGDEQLAAGDAARVERGEALERLHVVGGGVADGQRRGGVDAARGDVAAGAEGVLDARPGEGAQEVVVEHGHILRCGGPSHIGRMVRVRRSAALLATADPLRRKSAILQGKYRVAGQRATAAWSASKRSRTGHVARWSLTSPQACIPA